MAGGAVLIRWYATGFRGDQLEIALNQIGEISLRHGATSWQVFRNRDDRYVFQFITEWNSKEDWERYWYGDDFCEMRAATSGWYQVPLLYVWHDKTGQGQSKMRTTDDSDRAVAAEMVGGGGGDGPG